MDVYVVRIERSSIISGSKTYTDNVYDSEEKAWDRVEKKVNELTNIVLKSKDAEIWFSEFRSNSFVLAYYSIFGSEYIRYYIDKRKIK